MAFDPLRRFAATGFDLTAAIRHSAVSPLPRAGDPAMQGGGGQSGGSDRRGEIEPSHAAPSRPTAASPNWPTPGVCFCENIERCHKLGRCAKTAAAPDAHEAPQIASTAATENCATCRYGRPMDQFGDRLVHCRRFPQPTTDVMKPPLWQMMRGDDWCGEYAPKEAAR